MKFKIIFLLYPCSPFVITADAPEEAVKKAIMRFIPPGNEIPLFSVESIK